MDIVQIVIQGGAVGLCAFIMYILWKLIGNHMNHNTEVLTKNTEVLTDLKDVITKLENTLDKKL
ncbi:MAG: hypothetical protein K9M15_02795 [Candidatus Marinimicrobia bacterium]|nr:hypothetical protein [Candidatus Neomarinimicrobiota bacterium]